MAVCFWYFVKYDLSSSVHWTNNLLQVTRKTRSCLSGQVVPFSNTLSQQNTQKMSFFAITNSVKIKEIIHYLADPLTQNDVLEKKYFFYGFPRAIAMARVGRGSIRG